MRVVRNVTEDTLLRGELVRNRERELRTLVNLFIWEIRLNYRLPVSVSALRRIFVLAIVLAGVGAAGIFRVLWLLLLRWGAQGGLAGVSVVLACGLGYIAVGESFRIAQMAPKLRDLQGRLSVLRAMDVSPSRYLIVWLGMTLIPGWVVTLSLVGSFVSVGGVVWGAWSTISVWVMAWLCALILPFSVGCVACMKGSSRPAWLWVILSPMGFIGGIVAGAWSGRGFDGVWSMSTAVLVAGLVCLVFLTGVLAVSAVRLLGRDELGLFDGMARGARGLMSPCRAVAGRTLPSAGRAVLSQMRRSQVAMSYWRGLAVVLLLPSGLSGWLIGGGVMGGLLTTQVVIAADAMAVLGMMDSVLLGIGIHANRGRLRWLAESMGSVRVVAVAETAGAIMVMVPGSCLLCIVLFVLKMPIAGVLALEAPVVCAVSGLLGEGLIRPVESPGGSVVDDPLVAVISFVLFGGAMAVAVYFAYDWWSVVGLSAWLVLEVLCAYWVCCRWIRVIWVMEES